MADVLTRRRRGDATRRTLSRRALTSSAAILRPSRILRLTDFQWQRELWDFYESIEEFRFAMLWHSQTMSRVRLTAARITPDGEEPELLTSGVAVDLMRDFFNGTSGQSEYLKEMDIQLGVPGEGYVVAYDDEDGRHWSVKAKDEIQVGSGRAMVDGRSKAVDIWEVEIDEGVWQPLPVETLVFRQWRPSARKHFLPDSSAKAALNTMRVLRMLDRRVIAMSVSRLASNGILLYPQEVTFPAKPGFEKEADPFTAEWMDIAGKVIADPGSALAAIPLPMKVPKEFIESFKHMDFANSYDERLMELINLYRDRLATGMNVPKEVVTGMGDTSHWNAWTLDEQGIKVHVAPEAELICGGVTQGWLHPAMKLAGESIVDSDGARIICWYDTSELNVPPNRAESAEQAHAEFAITTEAYLREKGLDSADMPSDTELRRQILISMAKDPAQAGAAIEALELPGPPVAGATTGPGGVDAENPSAPTPAAGPPDQPTPEDNQPSGTRSP